MKGILIFFIFFASVLFAQQCEPEFEENVIIEVLDAKGRAIENALVQITYQADITTGKGYVTTIPKYTNKSGRVGFIIKNREVVKERVDCTYKIVVIYDNAIIERKARVGEHGGEIEIKMPVYELRIKAIDQKGNPLSGGEIIVRDRKFQIGDDGYIRFQIGSGISKVELKYGSGITSRDIEVNDDLEYVYQVNVYELEVFVLDDEGKPLEAKVNVDHFEYKTDEQGVIRLKRLLNAHPVITAEYNNLRKQINTDLSLQRSYYIIYDFRAPKIWDIKLEEREGNIVLTMYIKDLGEKASGLSSEGVKVSYKVGENTYFAPVYLKEANKYEVILDKVKGNILVNIKIEAMDNEGNIRTINGYFTVEEEKIEESGINGIKNDQATNNKNNEIKFEEIINKIKLEYIILGGVLLIGIILLIRFLKAKMENG